MSDSAQIRDAVQTALEMARDMASERIGIVGYGIIELYHADGSLGLVKPFANKVTDTGDTYYAQQAIYNVPPVNATGATTKLTGMQIGSGNTAEAKSGAGAAMVTFLFGRVFDGGFPTAASLGAGLGAEATYKTTFAAGEGTSTTVNEAVLTVGALGSGSNAANTIARVLTGTINKGALDSLAITWKTKFLGS